MSTPAKKTAPVAQKTVTKPAAKAAPRPAARADAKAAGPSAEPSLRFHHSVDLRSKTDKVLQAIDTKPDHAGHPVALADLVGELVEAGMDYYFLRPLKLADVGFLTEQSARLGLSGAVKLINSVSRKFIVRMDSVQLQVVATHIRSLS